MENFVYICYDDPDEKVAGQMCEFIEKKGIKCFYRHRDVPSDEQNNLMFEESSISDSNCVVAILSESFVKSNRLKFAKASVAKCVVFSIDDLDLKAFGLTNAKKINAANHPKKQFGHILPEINNYIDVKKKIVFWKRMIIGVVAFLSVLILVSYLYTTGEVKAEEPSISGYIDISQTEFLEKNMSARQSSVIEKNLPFGKVQYGMSVQDWQHCMDRMLENEGVTNENKNGNIIMLPGDKQRMELDTSKDFRLTLEPAYNEKGKLYALYTRVERKSGTSRITRSLIDEVLTEIIGASDKYSGYAKYHILREGGLTPFYCLIKNNEKIIVRSIDTYNVEITYANVPAIPKDIFESDYLTFQFNKRNMH